MSRKFASEDWDRYARDYDFLSELHPYADMINEVVQILRSAECPILDAGCGTGNLTRELQEVSAEQMVGIDSSSAMLKRARGKCTGVEFRCADLNSALPFEPNTFGAIACINALYALVDPVAVLQEFFRLLRPQGLLVLVTPKLGYENGLILKRHCQSRKPDSYWQNAHETPEREERLIRQAIPEEYLADRFIRIARFNRAIASERLFHFFTALELSSLVHKCGFTGVRIKETYADQNLLLVATRDRERKAR